MIDREWVNQFAAEWIDAWNAHDLERIFSHYTDDFEMTSPLIVKWMNEPSGTLKGKDAIRPYWQKGLVAVPPLHFELVDVLPGVDSLIILFSRAPGHLGADVMILNADRLVIKSIAHHRD